MRLVVWNAAIDVLCTKVSHVGFSAVARIGGYNSAVVIDRLADPESLVSLFDGLQHRNQYRLFLALTESLGIDSDLASGSTNSIVEGGSVLL